MCLARLFGSWLSSSAARLVEDIYEVGHLLQLSDEEIGGYLQSAADGLVKAQAVVTTIGTSVSKKQAKLDKLLREYERVRNLAAIEGEKAEQLLKELRRRDRQALITTILLSLVMILVGFVFSHFARLWLPGFTF